MTHFLAAQRIVSRPLVNLPQIQRELTVVDTSGEELVEHRLWREDTFRGEEVVVLPRNYRVPWLGPTPPTSSCFVFEPTSLCVRSRVTLRPRQLPAYEALLADVCDKILCLACGRGKTVVALHAACTGRRMPVLIIVPTTALMTQWENEIVKHTTCPRSMIGRIQGDVRRYRNCPFTVAMLNTVSLQDLPSEVLRYFALIVLDEAHRMGAPLLGRCAGLFPGERWSLTATPERADGMDALFRPHLGEVVLRDTEHDLKPTLYVVKTGIVFNEHAYGAYGKRLGRLYNAVARHEERNRIILGYVQRAVAKGRTPILLGERVDQLQWFVRELGYDPVTRGPVGGLFCGPISCEVRVVRKGEPVKLRWTESQADMRERRVRALTRRVLCATSILGKEGLDKPSLDTAIIPIPIGGEGRLDQTVGRILREMLDKADPVAVTFVDSGITTAWDARFGRVSTRPGRLQKTAMKMADHARSLGYRVIEVEAGR